MHTRRSTPDIAGQWIGFIAAGALVAALAGCAIPIPKTPDPRVELLERRLAPVSISEAERISLMTQDEVLAALAR